jgi:hypothetical protein
VTPAGVISTFASGFGPNSSGTPSALAFDAAGNLYVADSAYDAVDKVTPANVLSTPVSVPFTLGGTAQSGIDYSGVTSSPLVIAAGQTSATITGTLLSDPGHSQTLTITLGTPSGASLGSPAVNTLTIGEPPAPPASISAASGTPQSTPVANPFANPLVVTVQDSYGDLVPGATVTFTAPSSGASGTFANRSATVTATTNAAGQASESFTANNSAGDYTITAAVSGVSTPASFTLNNTSAMEVAAMKAEQLWPQVTTLTNPLGAGGTAQLEAGGQLWLVNASGSAVLLDNEAREIAAGESATGQPALFDLKINGALYQLSGGAWTLLDDDAQTIVGGGTWLP